jgi:hypothetical protein
VAVSTNEADVEQEMPAAGTFEGFRARLSTAPGLGEWTFTVRKNGADTGITCTISGAATSCAAGSSGSFVEGDTMSVKAVPTAGAASSAMRWTARY